MKPIFIELTMTDGRKFKGNILLLQRYGNNPNGGCFVIGWNNNGGFDVKESYTEISAKIEVAIK